MKKVVAGMDLHSNNVVIGIMDLDGKRVASRKVPCELKEVVKFLAPYKKHLEKIGVESTYNWYWLTLRAWSSTTGSSMPMTPTTRSFWPNCCA